MATYLFSAYFDGHFVTIATVQINLIPDPYTWAIVLLVESKFIFGLVDGAFRWIKLRSYIIVVCKKNRVISMPELFEMPSYVNWYSGPFTLIIHNNKSLMD